MRIIGIAQRGTEHGLIRIQELVQDKIDFTYLEDWKKNDWDKRIHEVGEFDGILSQCITHIPEPYRQKTVLFALGSANRRILSKPAFQAYLKSHPLKGLWVNNKTVANALRGVGLTPKVMYRANETVVPELCPPKPKNRFILWYASEWNGCLQPLKAKAKAVIEALGDHKIKVFIFPHKEGWSANKRHVIALGKINVQEILPTVHGMVRFGELGDFGRINYDVVSHGKWVLNHDVDEPWMESVHPEATTEEIVKQIVQLVDKDPEEERTDRWNYAKKYFTPKAMSDNWVKELKQAFEPMK